MGRHLVFYDGECGLCDHAVQVLLKIDTDKLFNFAPLQGETAKQWQDLPRELDTVVLIENYKTNPQIFYFSSAVFRSLYLVGGFWTLPGLLYFLPAKPFNFIYRFIAKRRHKFFPPDQCTLPTKSDTASFLP